MSGVVNPRIAVVGSTMVDLVAYVDRVPGAGETVWGSEFELGFGGKGANQAVMARMLGADVLFVNRVGDDTFGELTTANLRERGLDLALGKPVVGTSTGVAPIWVEPSGTNRIVVVPGANAAMNPKVVEEELSQINQLDAVVCQLEIPQPAVAAAFRRGRDLGAMTVLNPAPAMEVSPEILRVTDWIIPNEIEFAELFGSSPSDDALLRADAQLACGLIVTLGPEGAAVVRDGEVVRVAAIEVEAIDTTGAGDAFVGGFVFAMTTGLDLLASLRFAVVCGSLSTAGKGTQTSFPSAVDVRKRLA